MSFRRYIAATAREALDRVRRELGEDAVILSNKRLGPGRIEVVAAGSHSMQALVDEADRPQALLREGAAARANGRAEARGQDDARAPKESFQDYIRRQTPASAARPRASAAETPVTRSQEAAPVAARARLEQRAEPARKEPSFAREGVAMYHDVATVQDEPTAAPTPEPVQSAPLPAVFRPRLVREGDANALTAGSGAPGALSAPRQGPPPSPPQAAAPQTPEPSSKALPAVLPGGRHERDDSQVMAELRSLRAALSDRIAALESSIASVRPLATAKNGHVRSAAPTRVMTRLLMSGFSPELARRVAGHTPTSSDAEAIDRWLHEVIAGNLRCAPAEDGLVESQGALALVGPTGVGKTTTVAKLAARFAVRYGAAQLGLVTLDSYRIAAHEQLRSYARILGVPMHVAQDGATLRELLASLQGKRLVLVDTSGLSQRDERVEESLGILGAARFNGQPIRRVLVLNAASHSETLDEVARAWRAQETAGAVVTKLDEAARMGGAIDCLLRHKLMLYGLTNGQRVPEDWHAAGARLVTHVALKPSAAPCVLNEDEVRAWAEQPSEANV